MSRNIWVTLAAGAGVLIAAVVGLVVVPQHQPGEMLVGAQGAKGQIGQALCQAQGPSSPYCGHGGHYVAVGLSQTVYDVLRIATWACVIVGLILVAVGLIQSWRASQPSRPA